MAPAAAGWLRHACGARKTFTTFTARKLAVNDPIEPSPPPKLASCLAFFSNLVDFKRGEIPRGVLAKDILQSLSSTINPFLLVTFFRAIYGDANSSDMLRE